MSFLLYNPLEAMVLILPLWIFNRNRLNWKYKKRLFKVFVKDCYIVGNINLLHQIPLNYLSNSLLFSLWEFISMGFSFMVLYHYNKKRFQNNKLILCCLIFVFFQISLILLVSNSQIYLNFITGTNVFINELLINLIMRFVQLNCILILFGGYKLMFKEKLIKNAKKTLGKTVASTSKLVGESKLSDKLKAEVKNSK